MTIQEILSNSFLSISLWNWAYFVGALILTLILQKLIVVIIGRRLIKMAEGTDTMADELVAKAIIRPLGLGIFLLGFFFSLKLLELNPADVGFDINQLLSSFLVISLTICITWFLLNSVEIIRYYLEKLTDKTETKLDDQLVPIVVKSLKVAVFVLAVLVVLQNFGYSVTSILASLGIGGVAIALASKDTVENIFGSIVVFSDKPFQLEDWVVIGDVEGTVEEVGIRSTKIRRFDNALVSVPNSKLTTSHIVNYSRMQKRRIKTTLQVTYETPPAKIREMIKGIEDIIAGDDRFKHDYYLVKFNSMGDFGLGIFIYCFTKSTVWAEFLEVQEDFYLSIMELAAKLGVEFAYPTQTLYVNKTN